jgi:2-amino-4-hydroxy-6-hydroxymethyldihydropteridine diphosphokinase
VLATRGSQIVKYKQVFLGLGSNLGDRDNYLQMAITCLQENKNIQVVQQSSVIETDPVGEIEQGAFLNQVVEIETNLEPLELLAFCLRTEKLHGRVRTKKWGPRTIDIDILSFDNLVIQFDGLELPHSEMHNRMFVLQPLSEIAPSFIHPKTKDFIRAMVDSLVS